MSMREEPNTSNDLAYQKIKQAIIGGYYRSGERLIEQELAQKLGLSRTPVREALRRLEREGFIEKTPYKGVTVRKFTTKEAESIYQVRAALEGLAAYLVAQHGDREVIEELRNKVAAAKEALAAQDLEKVAAINNEFHDLLACAHDNEVLTDLLLNLRACISILRVTTWTVPGRPAQTLAEHEAIVAAIARGSPERAREMAIRHIENSWKVAGGVLARQAAVEL